MTKIILLQFKHTWKIWLSSLLIFIVSGFIVGTCFDGIFTISELYPHITVSKDPSYIYYYPMFFGILTLFIVSNGVIKLIINSMSKEYILWNILGAKPSQLALMIGGQISLISIFGSLIGFVFAVPFTVKFNYWIYKLLNSSQNMINLPINFSFKAFILTIVLIMIISFLSGYFHSYKIFFKYNNFNHSKKLKLKFKKIIKISIEIFITLLIIFIIYKSLVLNTNSIRYLSIGNNHEAAKTYVLNLLLILFLLMVLISLTFRNILIKFIKIWTKILPKKYSSTLTLAYWNSIFDNDYLFSIIVPLLNGSFLLTGIIYITSNITNGGTAQEAFNNSVAAIIIFLGAPLLMILSNVLTITIIHNKDNKEDINQLYLMGFTPNKIFIEKVFESTIYSLTFAMCSILFNILLYSIVHHIEYITNNSMNSSIYTIFTIPFILLVIIFCFMLMVNYYYKFSIKK